MHESELHQHWKLYWTWVPVKAFLDETFKRGWTVGWLERKWVPSQGWEFRRLDMARLEAQKAADTRYQVKLENEIIRLQGLEKRLQRLEKRKKRR